MGDDTFAPVHFVRPELGDPPPVGTGDIQTQIFDPEAVQEPTQLSGGTDAASGNYAANQEAINDRIGGNDFAQVPQEQPAGLAPPPEAAGAGAGARPARHLGTPMRAAGQSAPWTTAIVNGDPDDEDAAGETMELWDERGRDLRPPSEWERMPDTGGTRGWANRGWQLPPTDRPRMRKSVRFGDADVLTVAADAEDVRRIQSQGPDLDSRNATMSWWAGSGVNRATDPLNTGEAVRHVPTPRLPTDGLGYPSSWRASRQPGFGRRADAPGAFPFNAREQMITELMQGKRVDASHIDLLQGALNDAVRAERVQHKEWVKMSALIRHLKYGVVLGNSRPYARALDSRTLQILLDMADAASAVV